MLQGLIRRLIRVGRLSIVYPGGRVEEYGDGSGPPVTVRLTARGVRGKALGQPLDLNPFIAEKLGQAAQGFDETTLRAAFLELADADYLLKTGQAGPELLEHAVITLCGGGAASTKR